MPAFIQQSLDGSKSLNATPPFSPVRTMAEWEEVEALMITWTAYPEILTEIVRYAVDEARVIIVTQNQSSVSNQLQNAGIALDNVEFLPVSFNSVWSRDYGPWTVYTNDADSLAIADYVYNRPQRPQDDQIPAAIADYFAVPLYNADDNPYRWVHSGGNHLRDGYYNAFSSDLVLQENSGKSGREIAEYARIFMGVEDYRIFRRLPYDGIHHLDMHMRTLDEETIAIGWYPEGVADGPQIEKNIEYLRNHFRTPYGNVYRIIRQQMPPEGGNYPPFADYRTYSNGIFINNTLLVPTYEEQFDTTALRIYQEYLPGYRVVGINCNDMIGALGALHCITKLVGVEEPLRIGHPRLRDAYLGEGDYEALALLQHRSGIASATLHYRMAPEETYTAIEMTPDPDLADHWRAAIPAISEAGQIQYYIEAVANDGKTQVRPLPAPEGYYFFQVRPYQEAPEARWVQTNRLIPQGGTIHFTDDSANGLTSRNWSFPGATASSTTDKDTYVQYDEAGVYTVTLEATNPVGSHSTTSEEAVTVPVAHEVFSEDFTNGIDAKWTIINEDEDATAWELYGETDCNGPALTVQNYFNSQRFTREYLHTSVNLAAGDQARLFFDVAYARRNNSRWDELRINIIDQDGEITNVYNKGNSVLATHSNVGFPFEPDGCQDWRTEEVKLDDWIGQNIIVEFESIGDRGNNLYLDNISFELNFAPDVTITDPTDGTIYGDVTDPFTQSISIEALDSDGEVISVELYVNDELVETLNDAPYTTTFLVEDIGIFCFQAKAIDDDGAESWSTPVCIESQPVSTRNIDPLPLDLQLSPNPARDVANLLIQSEAAFPRTIIEVVDVKGRILSTQWLDIRPGSQTMMLGVSQLPPAQYWVRMTHGQQQRVVPFSKQ